MNIKLKGEEEDEKYEFRIDGNRIEEKVHSKEENIEIHHFQFPTSQPTDLLISISIWPLFKLFDNKINFKTLAVFIAFRFVNAVKCIIMF